MRQSPIRARLCRAGISLVLAIGCMPAPTRPVVMVTPLGTERTYPPTPDGVAIPLYAAAKPECPFDEIAALTAEGLRIRSVEAEVLAALRAKARSIGAHAIIEYSQGMRHSSNAMESDDIHVRSGTAIRFRSADCMK